MKYFKKAYFITLCVAAIARTQVAIRATLEEKLDALEQLGQGFNEKMKAYGAWLEKWKADGGQKSDTGLVAYEERLEEMDRTFDEFLKQYGEELNVCHRLFGKKTFDQVNNDPSLMKRMEKAQSLNNQILLRQQRWKQEKLKSKPPVEYDPNELERLYEQTVEVGKEGRGATQRQINELERFRRLQLAGSQSGWLERKGLMVKIGTVGGVGALFVLFYLAVIKKRGRQERSKGRSKRRSKRRSKGRAS